ncbi:MAG: hypothetical protein ACK419_04215, partial [Pyrinomonadaceae bacterium]
GLQSALDGKSDVGHTHNGLAPSGGTTGQVLKKNSNTDYDYSWQSDNTSASQPVSDAPGTTFNINVASPGTTLVSKSLSSLTAGTLVRMTVVFEISNNSGATATYTYRGVIGSTALNVSDSTTHAASATNRALHIVDFYVQIGSTTSRLGLMSQRGVPAASGAAATGAAANRYGWVDAGDLTGNQTISFSVFSSTTTATQLAILLGYKIEVLSSNP